MASWPRVSAREGEGSVRPAVCLPLRTPGRWELPGNFLPFFFFFLSRPEVALKVLDWSKPTGSCREARVAPRTYLAQDPQPGNWTPGRTVVLGLGSPPRPHFTLTRRSLGGRAEHLLECVVWLSLQDVDRRLPWACLVGPQGSVSSDAEGPYTVNEKRKYGA